MKKHLSLALLAASLGGLTSSVHAADPIMQTKFTADPAPLVHDGVVYLYTSHDEDDAPAGIIDYKGKSYVFGFNYKINFARTKDHHERRSVCVAEMKYNPDGTIQELPWWEEAESVTQLEKINPYKRVEGETICWSEGIKSQPDTQGGMNVYPTRTGAFITVKGVDFGAGAKSFHASVASAGEGGNIELHLDSPTGPLLGTCAVATTGGAEKWLPKSCQIKGATGVHDLVLVFTGGDELQLNLDCWKFD